MNNSSTPQLVPLHNKGSKKDKYHLYEKDDISTKSHNDLFTSLNQQRLKVKGNDGRAKSRRERDEINTKSNNGESNKSHKNNTNININENDTTKFNERDMASRVSSTLNTEFIFDDSHNKKDVRQIDKSQSKKDIIHYKEKSRRDSMSSTSKIGGFKSQMGKSQINDFAQEEDDEVFNDEKTNHPHYKTNTTKVAHSKQREETLAIKTQQSIKSDVLPQNQSIDSKYQFKPSMNKKQQSQIKKRESVYQETVDEIKDSDEDNHQIQQLGRKKKSSVFKSQKSIDAKSFVTPKKLITEMPEKQHNTVTKQSSCQPTFATSGPCGLFARASVDKFGGLFKLQCKKIIDQGLDVHDDGFLTNKNSAAPSKAGTRKASEEDECDIHTSSDDAIQQKDSSLSQGNQDKNTQRLKMEYQKLKTTLHKLQDEKSNGSIVSPTQRSFFAKKQQTLNKLNPQFMNDDAKSDKSNKHIKKGNHISSQQSEFRATLNKPLKRAHSRHQSEANYNIFSKQKRTPLSKKLISSKMSTKSLKGGSPTVRGGKSVLNIKSKLKQKKNFVPGHEADADDISIKIIQQELIKNLQDESSIDLHDSNNYSFSSGENGNTSYHSQKIVNKSRRNLKKSKKSRKGHYSCSSCSGSYSEYSPEESITKKSRHGDNKSRKSYKAQRIKNTQYASPPHDRSHQFKPHNNQHNFQSFNPFGFTQGYQTDQSMLPPPNMNPFYNQYVNPNQLMAMQQQYMQLMYQQMQGFKNASQVQQNNGNINETINQVFQMELVINPMQISIGNNNQNTYTVGQGNGNMGMPDLSQLNSQTQNASANMNTMFQPQQMQSPAFQNVLSQSSLGQNVASATDNNNHKLFSSQLFPQQSHRQSNPYDSQPRVTEVQESNTYRTGSISPYQSKIDNSPKNQNIIAGVYQPTPTEQNALINSVNLSNNEESILKQTNQNYLDKLKNKFLSGMTGAARIAASEQHQRETSLPPADIGGMYSPKQSRNNFIMPNIQVVTDNTNNIQQQHQIEMPHRESIAVYKSQNDTFLQNRSQSINQVFNSNQAFLKKEDHMKISSITPMREREQHLELPLQQKHQKNERFEYKGNNNAVKNKDKNNIYQHAAYQHNLKTQSSNINEQPKKYQEEWHGSTQDQSPTQFEKRVMQTTRLGSETNGKNDIQNKLKMLNLRLSQELQAPKLYKQHSEQQSTMPTTNNQDQFNSVSMSYTPLSEKIEEENLLSPKSYRNEEMFSENDERYEKQNSFNNPQNMNMPKQQKGEVMVISFKQRAPQKSIDNTPTNQSNQSVINTNTTQVVQQKSRFEQNNNPLTTQNQSLKQIPPISIKATSETVHKNSMLSPGAHATSGEFNFEDNKPRKNKPILKHVKQDSQCNLPKQQPIKQSSKQQDIFIEILDKKQDAKCGRVGGSLIPQTQTSLADMFDQKLKGVKDKFETRIKQYNASNNEDILSNNDDKIEQSIEPKKEKTQRTKEDILELRKKMMKSKVRVKKDNFVAETKPEDGDQKKKNPPPDLMTRLASGQKAQVDLKEMKKINNKIYENLPEIKKKKEEEKKKEEYKQRQIQAKKYAEQVDLKRKQHFQKKQTLQGKDDFE